MSQIKKLPAPKAWSRAAKGWIAKLGNTETAKAIGIMPSTLSQWHRGHARPSEERVEQIITMALGQGVCLTPADLGRPDLVKKGGEG